MSRYIDADKLIERLVFKRNTDNIDRKKYAGLECAIAQCKKAPTADVVEVRHGHWISQEEAVQLDRYDLAYTCSVCGHCDWDCTESENFNYCPNCGAKMDGERREE